MKAEFKTIITDRLILRKIELTDTEDMFNYACRDTVTEFLSFDTYKSVEAERDYIKNKVLPRYESDNPYIWAIELKETGKVIGCIDAANTDKVLRRAELGWVLLDDYWGRGIMPEAGKAVLEFLFSEGFVRIQALHFIENKKSGRVMQKIGMTHEGTLKKYTLDKHKALVDCEMYAIVKEDLLKKL